MIRAKMKCATVEKFEGGENVKLTAVSSDSPENKAWSKYTPNGSVTLQINNPDACDKFTPGKEYFIDFTPVS